MPVMLVSVQAIREATESDVEAIAEAHRDSIGTLGAAYYPPAVVLEWAGVVTAELYVQAMSKGEVFFIATGTVDQRSAVLGFASDYQIEGTKHGTSAYVRGAAARQGIGSALLSRAEAFGFARGARSIRIEASLGAVGFYQKHGYVEIGRGTVSLPSGFPMACVFMQKDL